MVSGAGSTLSLNAALPVVGFGESPHSPGTDLPPDKAEAGKRGKVFAALLPQWLNFKLFFGWFFPTKND